MSKEEFRTTFENELRGMCLAAFAEMRRSGDVVGPMDYTREGKWMAHQFSRVRDLIDRMYSTLAGPLPVTPEEKKHENSKPRVAPDTQKRAV